METEEAAAADGLTGGCAVGDGVSGGAEGGYIVAEEVW